MSGRGRDPKEIRASLVDSGWSSAPPAPVEIRAAAASDDDDPDRPLPSYEEAQQGRIVTQIDDDIQSRVKNMGRASLADAPRPGVPALPPPPAVIKAPPSLPPPPPPVAPSRPSSAPLPSFPPGSTPDDSLVSIPDDALASLPDDSLTSIPDDALASLPDDEPLPSFPPGSVPDDVPPPAAPVPFLRSTGDVHTDTTAIEQRPSVLPSSNPPPFRAPPAPPAPVMSLPAAPSLLSALKQRVHFAGGEVPLWSLLVPLLVLLSLASAFAAAALGQNDTAAAAPAESASAAGSAAPAPSTRSAASEPSADLGAHAPEAPALPSAPIDAEALAARGAEELSKDDALALAASRRDKDVKAAAELRRKLGRDPGLFKDAALMTELRRAAEDPLTAPDALSAMADAPGPLSADLLYEMWTGTVVRNSATELARSLVFSKEVRAKASPELAVTLDLRVAETCEQNKALLPRVTEKGDRRSLALLAKLARKFGCGANKRQDCYPCLREDKAVEDAMTAVKRRREPKPFPTK